MNVRAREILKVAIEDHASRLRAIARSPGAEGQSETNELMALPLYALATELGELAQAMWGLRQTIAEGFEREEQRRKQEDARAEAESRMPIPPPKRRRASRQED